MFVTPAYAQAAGGAGAGAAFAQFIPLILIFAIMYFLMIRPQQKRLKAHRTMVENVKCRLARTSWRSRSRPACVSA